MKNKIIISAILTIAMCFSLIAGSTLALFTSESKVNVAVTSGKVSVVAYVVESSLSTSSLGVAQESGRFANGGQASITTENGAQKLQLTGLTPGDVATFVMKVENKSTVDFQYRFTWKVDGELYEYLTATVNGREIVNDKTAWSVWEGDDVQDFQIHVSLPQDASNDAQGKTAEISFTVEAMQKNAVSLVLLNGAKQDSLEDALASANHGDTLAIYGEQAPFVVEKDLKVILNGVDIYATEGHAIEVRGNATIEVARDSHLTGGKNGSAIYVAEGAKLTLTGKALTAVANGGKDYVAGMPQYSSDDNATAWADTGASAIGGKGDITITNMVGLTALGYGVHGAGIGGESKNITIKGTTIEMVRGGFINETGIHSDEKYLKSEPEGGAAIGSSANGATITLESVRIKEALGGSKAAGIGAMFHRGATISIKNSIIDKVVGGNSSAGIGGSRIAKENVDQPIFITIENSDITAYGGKFGAGIGSGYDTHCKSHGDNSRTTINISGTADDTINAYGGQYAAGIGTGYHVADLAGEITGDVVINAHSGEAFYKNTYTQAQNIGFGVVDPAREGKDNNSTLNYKGEVIGIDTITSIGGSATYADVAHALANGGTLVFTESVDLTDTATGKTYLEANGDVDFYLNDGVTLNFSNVTGVTGTGSITIHGGTVKVSQELYVTSSATLVIEGGTHNFGTLSAVGNGTIIVNGGTLNCYGTYGSTGGGINFAENGKAIINGGTLNMYQPFNLNGDRCDNAYVEINGGNINLLASTDKLFSVRNIMDKDAEGTLRGSSIKITGGVFTTTYQLDSDGDANAFIRNEDSLPAGANRVLVSNEIDSYNCVVTGGTFYGSWQRNDNNRLHGTGTVENTIAGWIGAGYEIVGNPTDGYKVVPKN